MHSHLVAIKVGVEGWADQGVQLDGTTIHQLGFKGLNSETVQRGSAVQQNGVSLDHLLQHLHHLVVGLLDELLSRLDVVHNVLTDQTVNHEGLEELNGHLLRQTALMHFQLGSHHNHRTA